MNINKYKKLLLERLKVLAEVDGYVQNACQPVELDQTRVGRLSRMDALQGQAMAQETARRRDNESARIRVALKRIEEGEYGYCLSCGELIASNRLALDPTATVCITCASV